jgi:hypothetical protein
MKTLASLLLLIGFIPLCAGESVPSPTVSQALRAGTIAEMDLKKATFEQALAIVRTEWERQYPTLDFPVSIADYERNQGGPPLITMSLRDVPFIKALQYVGEASRRRLIERPEHLTLEEMGLIVEDWVTKSHPVSEELLGRLGLGNEPTPEDLASAYSKYGVKLADWMKLGYHDGFLVVLAFETQQEQIAGINLLLSQGYEITKSEQGVAPQSATRSESDSEGGNNPESESKPRPR